MEEENKISYPYLGVHYIEDKPYVVFFTEPDMGVVVHNETDSETVKFGYYGSFAEEVFDILPEDTVITMSN